MPGRINCKAVLQLCSLITFKGADEVTWDISGVGGGLSGMPTLRRKWARPLESNVPTKSRHTREASASDMIGPHTLRGNLSMLNPPSALYLHEKR